MSNFTINPRPAAPLPAEKLKKIVRRFLKSYDYHQRIEAFYHREEDRLKRGVPLPYSWDDFYQSFKAKDFWKDYHDCGSWIEIKHYFDHDKTKVENANFCRRDKLCPACAVRRAYKQQLKFLQILDAKPELLKQNWYYCVLTVKHDATETLETVFHRVQNLKAKITKAMRNSRSRGDTNFWSKFSGGMFSIETTHGRNGWHVHLNLLLNADPDQRLEITEVRNSKGQISHQNEEIRQFLLTHFDSQIHDIQSLDFSNPDKIRAALVEVIKYSLKFTDLSIPDIVLFYVKTRKKRLYGTFGNLWGLGLDKVELEGDEQLDGDFVELLLKRVMIGDMPDYVISEKTP